MTLKDTTWTELGTLNNISKIQLEEHPSEKYVFHTTSCACLAGRLFYFRLLAGKKFADLRLLVVKSIFSDENLRVKMTKEEKMKLHFITFHSSVIVCTCH